MKVLKTNWLQATLVLACFVSIATMCIVTWLATASRAEAFRESARSHLLLHADSISSLVDAKGASALPIHMQNNLFRSFDCYIINSRGEFLTKPRFSHVGGMSDTTPYNRAYSAGEDVAMMTRIDYRGEYVMTATTLVNINGTKQCLIVEMDMAEVEGAAWSNWLLIREFTCSIVAIYLAVCGYHSISKLSSIAAEKEQCEAVIGNQREAITDLVSQLARLRVELRESSTHQSDFYSCIRNFPDGGALIVKNGVVVMSNGGFARMCGKLSGREIEGVSADSFSMAPEAHRQLRERFTKDFQEQQVRANLGGKPQYVILSVTKIGEQDGNTYFVRVRPAEGGAK